MNRTLPVSNFRTYAEAAASSGPTGSGKVPPVPQVETVDEPHGSVQSVSEEEFKKLKGESVETEEQVPESAPQSKWLQIASSVQNFFSSKTACLSTKSKELARKSQSELKNPVVASQVIVAVSAIAAGYVGFAERSRILNAPRYAVSVHAAIVTGLVGLDLFLVNKFYPKYK